MEKRALGSLQVSVVGLGANNFGRRLDEAATARVVHAALDAGINFIDTAEVYGDGESERMIGAALRGRRDEVLIATKFRPPANRQAIRDHLEASLRRLETDHVDLYQIHFPDGDTPIETTLDALDELVREGKVREIGNSNFSGWQIADADWTSRSREVARFVSSQSPYSLLDRRIEAEVLPACRHFGLGLIPYSPLANGLLTGKYHRGQPAPQGARLAARPDALEQVDFDKIESLTEFATARNAGLLDLAFGWLLGNPAVTSVIAGATSPEQIAANVKAGDWRVPAGDRDELDAILKGSRPQRVG